VKEKGRKRNKEKFKLKEKHAKWAKIKTKMVCEV
jgi:hypothetical protein